MKEKPGNKEITVFQGRIMQGNRGVLAFTEFEDSVFKGKYSLECQSINQ